MLKHLTKGDIFFHPTGAKVLLKWSKTLQLNNQAKVISLLMLNSVLCPVAAIKKLLIIQPGNKDSPLLQFRVNNRFQPLIDTRVRKHLRNILKLLHVDDKNLTFHTFRRSGASFAFNHNVSVQNIQQHGTWTSDCVWRYITDSVNASSQVSDTFRSVLSS